MDAFEILVVILALTLAVFLALAIVATMYIIRILKQIEMITIKARNAVDLAESASRTFFQSITPAFIAQAIVKQVKKAIRK